MNNNTELYVIEISADRHHQMAGNEQHIVNTAMTKC